MPSSFYIIPLFKVALVLVVVVVFVCVVDKIIVSLVLFFEEKDTSFLCEKCLFFFKCTEEGIFTFGCFLFAFPMFFFRV